MTQQRPDAADVRAPGHARRAWPGAALAILAVLAYIGCGSYARATDAPAGPVRTEMAVDVPAVRLLDQDGRTVEFTELLGGGAPVVVEFFFTSCTTICPVRSATFGAANALLAGSGGSARFVSVSIDPEHDTPSRLLEYRGRFAKRPSDWHLLTGSVSDVTRMQQAFGAVSPSDDRMMHRPLTFIYTGHGTKWVRLEGMTSGRDLAHVVRTVVAPSDPVG